MNDEMVVYVCTRCTASAGEPGKCEYCGGQKVACRPGEDDDPIRRPLIDADGNVLTRAPIWWLIYTVPGLMNSDSER